MSTISIHGDRIGGRPAGRPTSGRMQPTGPEVGTQARAALWRFSASTRTQGAARDRLGIATVHNQLPATRELFSDAALAAVLRPPEPGRCSWDYYRALARERGESPPVPSPELFGLLGAQCSRCRTHFAAQMVAKREEAYVAGLVAAGYDAADARFQRPGDPRATGTIWAAGRPPAPSYYRPGRPR
jgi:hypothetical protein